MLEADFAVAHSALARVYLGLALQDREVGGPEHPRWVSEARRAVETGQPAQVLELPGDADEGEVVVAHRLLLTFQQLVDQAFGGEPLKAVESVGRPRRLRKLRRYSAAQHLAA